MGDWRDVEDRFDVILIEAGPKKISVLKIVRETLGLEIAEAKHFIENVPRAVKEDLSREEAEPLVDRLERADALVRLRRRGP